MRRRHRSERRAIRFGFLCIPTGGRMDVQALYYIRSSGFVYCRPLLHSSWPSPSSSSSVGGRVVHEHSSILLSRVCASFLRSSRQLPGIIYQREASIKRRRRRRRSVCYGDAKDSTHMRSYLVRCEPRCLSRCSAAVPRPIAWSGQTISRRKQRRQRRYWS